MADISREMARFINDIRQTDTYQEYEKQKKRMKEYPDLKEKIDAFRLANYELQKNTPQDQLFEKTDAFQKEYEDFREIPMVHDFLAAELDYCRMIQEINDVLYDEFTIRFE